MQILGILTVLVSSLAHAQPPKHPEAEKALAQIVLEKDFGEDLKYHSREVVTTARNDRVPGLNGLMFMRWKGDGPGTEVMASVQWFEKKDDLLRFYAKSTKRADYKLGKFDGTTLWTLGEAGYSWTDGEHFAVSLGGKPTPPPEMVKAWLAMIASKVAEVEKEVKAAVGNRAGEELGHGYSRRGEFIYFNGTRIDRAGAHDIDEFAKAVGYKLTLCSNVDADSFEVLSNKYTRDKDKVYFKWISPGRFWVVEIPKADPETFEVLGLDLAKDKNHVWIDDRIVQGADAKSAKGIFSSRIWVDKNYVWSRLRKIEGADPETFERIGESEFGYYRDSKRVYSYFGILKVVKGADPRTFQIPVKK